MEHSKKIKQDASRVKEDLSYYFPIVSLLPRGPYSQNWCKEQCGTLRFPGPLCVLQYPPITTDSLLYLSLYFLANTFLKPTQSQDQLFHPVHVFAFKE